MELVETSSLRFIFPRSRYPIYNAYLNLFVNYLRTQEINVSESDLKQLSIALGIKTTYLYNSVMSNRCEERAKTLLDESISLKTWIKRLLAERGTEVAEATNLSEAQSILSRYQEKFDQIEARKQEAIEQEKKAKYEQLKAIQEAQQKELKDIREAHKELYVDFDEFDSFGIRKGSKAEKILRTLKHRAITQQDFNWLKEYGFCNDLIEKHYYLQQGQQQFKRWRQEHKPWDLVNASASYRKAENLSKIKKELDQHYPFKTTLKNKKLHSALLTTYGGVCRDLKEYEKGIRLGNEAHQTSSLDFRPCTLLGAIHMETGKFDLGYDWYQKAKDRGFSEKAYDNDLKTIYQRASDEIKHRLKQSLLNKGHNYRWLQCTSSDLI
ncbi:hypothetical protein KDN34_05080 [Shewanella yunxiaonensis]|uniref:Uncharacterized protein n=1 Tax=Shewanella yunxiaonensis TaxID=2829809 RepID=A0ABX7YWW0_9GAMM|nr:hypothetical protein [Shewanella yunxiaonensis]QUN06826.1 hypothetical protein KDN34_05080 [Shewanella yunxiaonensis]